MSEDVKVAGRAEDELCPWCGDLLEFCDCARYCPDCWHPWEDCLCVVESAAQPDSDASTPEVKP
jgi:hypothetical protein